MRKNGNMFEWAIEVAVVVANCALADGGMLLGGSASSENGSLSVAYVLGL